MRRVGAAQTGARALDRNFAQRFAAPGETHLVDPATMRELCLEDDHVALAPCQRTVRKIKNNLNRPAESARELARRCIERANLILGIACSRRRKRSSEAQRRGRRE